MNKHILPVLSLVVLGLQGCFEPAGPYQTGLKVTREAEEVRVTKFYLAYEGADPKERKATLNVGDDCETAAASAGKLTLTENTIYVDQFEVIGQTESSHPLVPGNDTYGSQDVSVVAHTYLSESDIKEEETFRVPGGNPSEWEETREGESGLVTNVDYEGIAADEYVVSLESLGDLWEDLDDADAALSVNLLTRNGASASDIWASLDGNMLYIAAGNEEVSVGAEKVNAMKVEVYTVADVDPAASNVVETCLAIDKATFETTNPNDVDGTVRTAHLDPGCAQGFVSQQIGTQWWYNNVMVQAQLVTYEVEILDYGYEWFEVAGNSCFRETSLTKDDNDAELFVEYAVTEVTQTLHATGWEIGG